MASLLQRIEDDSQGEVGLPSHPCATSFSSYRDFIRILIYLFIFILDNLDFSICKPNEKVFFIHDRLGFGDELAIQILTRQRFKFIVGRNLND